MLPRRCVCPTSAPLNGGWERRLKTWISSEQRRTALQLSLTRSRSEAVVVFALHLGLAVFHQIRILFLQGLALSFLVVNLTTDWFGLLFSPGSTAQWFRVWNNPFKNLGMCTRDSFWKWPKHPTIAIAASWGVTYTKAEQVGEWLRDH